MSEASSSGTTSGELGAAAFFRVEGCLTRPGVLSAATYFAANAQGFRERALRLGQLAVAAPLYGMLGQNDRALANRLTYVALRGMSEDRLEELAEEYVERVLLDGMLQGGRELLQRARRGGQRIVLLSESVEPVVRRMLPRLGHVEAVLCNRLEVRDQRLTGRLLDPVVGGHDGGSRLERFANEHGVSLRQSTAYAVAGPDLLMLSRVGYPCAVNPDYTLRRAAREAGWPVLEYRA